MPENKPTFSTIRTPSSYPASRKGYLQGSRLDVRVPYREITLSDTCHGDHAEANLPLPVYDTSGPYTDPEVGIRLTRALLNSVVPSRPIHHDQEARHLQ
jgi:phosphomethylpyrimidine synthase